MAKQKFFPQPGDVYGRLTVLELTKKTLPSGDMRGAALCLCKCGNEVEVLTQNLKDRTRSCGCMKTRGTMSEKFRETRGQRVRSLSVSPGEQYGRLTVVHEYQERTESGSALWVAECQCECGRVAAPSVHNLVSGVTQSCGCLRRENMARISRERVVTHGLTNHSHYARWNNIRARCDNPENHHYKFYGGRGIQMCDEWYDVATFIAYLEDELGPCPDGWSLDRVDNDGDYEPGNLRWANSVTQRHNQRRGTSNSRGKSHDAD